MRLEVMMIVPQTGVFPPGESSPRCLSCVQKTGSWFASSSGTQTTHDLMTCQMTHISINKTAPVHQRTLSNYFDWRSTLAEPSLFLSNSFSDEGHGAPHFLGLRLGSDQRRRARWTCLEPRRRNQAWPYTRRSHSKPVPVGSTAITIHNSCGSTGFGGVSSTVGEANWGTSDLPFEILKQTQVSFLLSSRPSFSCHLGGLLQFTGTDGCYHERSQLAFWVGDGS